MPQWSVQAPDGKVIQFPDNFQQADVEREMYKMYSTPPAVPKPAAPDMQQVDITGKPQNPAAGMAGVPGGSSNPQPASMKYAAAVGAPLGAAAAVMGGATAIPAALPFLKAGMKMLPYVAASEGINYARQKLPFGKYIPPGAELAPYLIGGREAPKEKPTYPGAPLPEAPPPEAALVRGGQVYKDPAAGLGNLPFLKGQPSPPAPTPTAELMESAAYNTGPGASVQRGPIPGSREDIAETRDIQSRVREAAEGEGQTFESQQRKEWFGRNTFGATKGDLTGQPAKPVRYTKTRGVKASGASTAPPAPAEDLTPEWQRNLDYLKGKKR